MLVLSLMLTTNVNFQKLQIAYQVNIDQYLTQLYVYHVTLHVLHAMEEAHKTAYLAMKVLL